MNESELSAPGLRLPLRLKHLAPDWRPDVMSRLERLPIGQRQGMLDEWTKRCRVGGVRNTVAYLFGLIKKVQAGEFRLWAARDHTPRGIAYIPPSVVRALVA